MEQVVVRNVCTYIYTHMHVAKKKEAMNLKERNEGIWKVWREERAGKKMVQSYCDLKNKIILKR